MTDAKTEDEVGKVVQRDTCDISSDRVTLSNTAVIVNSRERLSQISMSQREDLGRVCEHDRTLSDRVKDGIDVYEHCYDPCSDGRILDEVRHTWESEVVGLGQLTGSKQSPSHIGEHS
jgi:hypothetical protein